MRQPNILFVIWDACRLEAVREHASNLLSLADENLWFENAIAPAGYSLPSHASMMTGEYLHQHGIFSRTHEFDSLPLVEQLGEMGYTRYGVSANGFASPRYRFDEPFDEFYNTQGQMVYPRGLDVHGYARKLEDQNDGFSIDDLDYTSLLSATLRHDNPIKSLINVTAAGISELASNYSAFQKIPHPRFSKYHEFSYSPSKNTSVITSILERERTSDEPFFLFTNYMDAHHPYAPPKRLQREYCDRTFSYYELTELAEQTLPWNHLQRLKEGNEVEEETLEDVRRLYAAEVRRVDQHLGSLLEALRRNGLYDETLIIITADHGENLGEVDRMGENRMGHECSASDHLLRVPLVVAHSALDGRVVNEYVSLKDLYQLFTGGFETLLQSAGTDVSPLRPSDGVVSSEVPPPANSALLERYPDLADILQRHISVCYSEDWKVVKTSADQQHAWNGDKECPPKEVPDHLWSVCEANLEALLSLPESEERLSESDISQLEALGYL